MTAVAMADVADGVLLNRDAIQAITVTKHIDRGVWPPRITYRCEFALATGVVTRQYVDLKFTMATLRDVAKLSDDRITALLAGAPVVDETPRVPPSAVPQDAEPS